MNRDEVVRIAVRIASRAPATQGQNVSSALIPWRLIHELRAAIKSEA